MKELTTSFNALLQDKRVRSEQSKYETIQRQRSSVINRYKRAYQEFLDLEAGLQSAKNWYAEMRETVGSLDKNVETFVNNRRSEGGQLLNQIEQDRASNKSSQAEMERDRLRGLMERMSMEPSKTPPQPSSGRPTPPALFQQGQAPRYPQANFQGQYQMPSSPPPNQTTMQHQQQQNYQGFSNPPVTQSFAPPPGNAFSQQPYNPSQFGRTPGPTSPPPNQTSFNMRGGPASPPPNQTSFNMRGGPASPPPNQTSFNMRGPASPPPNQTSFGQPQPYGGQTYGAPQTQQHQQQHSQGGYVPPGFVPPPPPPGPPPLGPQQTMHYGQQQQQQGFDGQGGYGQGGPQSAAPRSAQPQQPHDPWAGLNAWK